MAGVIGTDSDTGLGSESETSSNNHQAMNNYDTYVASANEVVSELGMYTGGNVGDGSGIEIGVLDITSGIGGASLIASGTIGTLSASARNTVSITPVALVDGNTYCMELRIISATAVSTRRAFQSSGSRTSTLTGATPLAATFTDNANFSQRSGLFGIVTDVASGPSITSTTDPAITGTAITITGTDFGASQGSGSVKQEQGAEVETLSIVSWSDTSITATSATIESTGLKYGTQTLRVTDDAAADDTTTYTAIKSVDAIQPEETDNGFNDLTSIATVGQLITAAGTLAVGMQIAFDNVISVQGGAPTSYFFRGNPDATFSFGDQAGPSEDIPDGVYTAGVRAWDDTDQTWGTIGEQTVQVGPVAGGISIKSNIKRSIKRSILQ